jgi:hypothetical protein
MAKKTSLTKLDIARWAALIPLTIVAILLYANIFIDALYAVFNKAFDEHTVANIVGFINATSLPALIVTCGYWISPRFKFKSTLVLVLFFSSLQIHYFFDTAYVRNNPFILFFVISYLLGLLIVYRLEKK